MYAQVKGCGTERLTVDNTAGGVALADIPENAVFALVRAKGTSGDGICWTDDGETAPTSSVGGELEVGETMWFDAHLSKFKAIRRDSNNITLVVTYYTPAG